MSFLGGIFGNTLVSGIENDPKEPEFDRVYVGARYDWNYVLVDAGTVHLGSGHNFTNLPSDAVIYHDAEGKAAAVKGIYDGV